MGTITRTLTVHYCDFPGCSLIEPEAYITTCRACGVDACPHHCLALSSNKTPQILTLCWRHRGPTDVLIYATDLWPGAPQEKPGGQT